MQCRCDSPASKLTVEEASAVLVSMLSGHAPTSIEVRAFPQELSNSHETRSPWTPGVEPPKCAACRCCSYGWYCQVSVPRS
jgi:hypothetical protein